MSGISVWLAGLSLLITFSVLLGQTLYRMGHISARVEELESWKTRVRDDMHEISERLENIQLEIKTLLTLIQERTERRHFSREGQKDET